MNPNEFSKEVQKKAQEVKIYVETQFPIKGGNVALRFVNGNFTSQGFQGTTFKKWESNRRNGTILVKTGKLRAATYITSQSGQFTVKNQMPYAKLQNEGFKGNINVKAHSRNKYSKTKVGTGKFTRTGKERTRTMAMKSGENNIKSHSRKINLPQRQFIPTEKSPSPVLNNAILRMLAKDIKNIMK